MNSVYTGAGGRDVKSEVSLSRRLNIIGMDFWPSIVPQKQVKDQELGKGYNKSLAFSKETGKPVRVVRGSKSESKYAPLSGSVVSLFLPTALI